MSQAPFNDLREFIAAARAIGQVKEIHGAHWDLEIGALTEMFAYREVPPCCYSTRFPIIRRTCASLRI